jgi:hypothetical protein
MLKCLYGEGEEQETTVLQRGKRAWLCDRDSYYETWKARGSLDDGLSILILSEYRQRRRHCIQPSILLAHQ